MLNKASLFPSPVSLTRPDPIIILGKTASSLRSALFESVGCFMLWEPGQREQHAHTHTYTQIPLHTQTEKPSGIYNWQTHSRNAAEQLQSWTIATNTTNTGFSSVRRQNIVYKRIARDYQLTLWIYLVSLFIFDAPFLMSVFSHFLGVHCTFL